MSITIDEGIDWDIEVPKSALLPQSLILEPRGSANEVELFAVMKKVAQFWEQKGIHTYFVYRQGQKWEMIPYIGHSVSLIDKIKIVFWKLDLLFRIVWGNRELSSKERQQTYTANQDLKDFKAIEVGKKVETLEQDVFYKQEMIDAQQIWEGKHIRVLYDHASKGKVSFSIVPKTYREKLTDLSLEEFQEVQDFAQKLKDQYRDHLCFQYHRAGQKESHFQEHVAFIAPGYERLGKLSFAVQFLLEGFSLNSAQQKEQHVQEFRKEFTALQQTR